MNENGIMRYRRNTCICVAIFLIIAWFRFRNKINTPEQIIEVEDRFRVAPNELRLECEPIHISIVCAEYKSSREVVTLIKSLLFYRKRVLHVHFIVEDVSETILSTLFQTWNIADFTVSFYALENYINSLDWIPSKHYSKQYGLLKLVVLNILPSYVSKVIILDTDTIFANDVGLLWEKFHDFLPDQALGLVENQSDWYLGTLWDNYIPWPALERGFNTGVMLVDCDKLRKVAWQEKWENVTRSVLLVLKETTLADQDITNSVLKKYPHLVHTLDCSWNYQISDNRKFEYCPMKFKHHVNIIHWNSRQKIKQNLGFVSSLYVTMATLNGDLLKDSVTECYDDYNSQAQSDNIECHEFTLSSYSLHRIHLYFLPFELPKTSVKDVSIVVQLSLDRLQMLEIICKHWAGPVSVSIFATDQETETLVAFVDNSNVLSQRKNIAYHVVYKTSINEIYPINLLRNTALQNAVTEYVFLYDVDFVPMPGLYSYILSHLSLQDDSNRTAFVIPAFESLWYKVDMPTTKAELLTRLGDGSITTFRSYMWPQGHSATNYSLWKTSTEPYKVDWENNFEPYIVINRKVCPKYDKRFSGFGWNKISHILEVHAAGFNFVVLPFGFVIHLPHSPSIDLQKYRSRPKYRQCLEILKQTFLNDILRKYDFDFYEAVLP